MMVPSPVTPIVGSAAPGVPLWWSFLQICTCSSCERQLVTRGVGKS